MAKKTKTPVVVAELGRPETASETAARKAENSRLYRERKTVNNLVFSLLVTLGLVAVIFLMVPRGTGNIDEQQVDVAELAEAAEPGAGHTLVAPEVPEAWKPRQAVLQRDGDVNVWRINYTTVDEATGEEAFASVLQAFTNEGTPVDAEWIQTQLEDKEPTGTEQLAGVDWQVYDYPDHDGDETNVRFGLAGAHEDDTLLVFGTADSGTLRLLAGDTVDALTP